MQRIRSIYAALFSAAIAILAAPALALAQAGQPGGGGTAGGPPTSPGGGALGGADAPARGGGSGWLWLLLALAVIAVVWYAMAARRRSPAGQHR
jgi:hypothetical protein